MNELQRSGGVGWQSNINLSGRIAVPTEGGGALPTASREGDRRDEVPLLHIAKKRTFLYKRGYAESIIGKNETHSKGNALQSGTGADVKGHKDIALPAYPGRTAVGMTAIDAHIFRRTERTQRPSAIAPANALRQVM